MTFTTALLLATAVHTSVVTAAEATAPRLGGQVYVEVCAACHRDGVAGAPRFGDRSTWQPLIDEGQTVVTAHGWVGVRGMPARGGRADLTLEAFAAAVVHMARAAGAEWPVPDSSLLMRIEDEVRERIEELARTR